MQDDGQDAYAGGVDDEDNWEDEADGEAATGRVVQIDLADVACRRGRYVERSAWRLGQY